MRINWFSPLPPVPTEIANHTARVLPALAQRAQVVLWSDQAAWNPRLESQAEVRQYRPDDVPWAEINRADVTIYQIGNHPEFHGPPWEVSRRHAGIVVLHDLCLQGLFCSWFQRRCDQPGYAAAMRRYYGEIGARYGEQFWAGSVSAEDMASHFPLTPLAVENALGVVVHTSAAFDRLRAAGRWALVQAPLPYAATPRTRLREGAPLRYRLVLVGYLGPNRRLEAVLQALADLPERDAFRLDVYGPMPDPEHVAAQIRSLGLDRLVTLHGYVSEVELEAGLAAADLGINLRYPTMGEASASQLRLWDHALPTLVTQADAYADLPADAVAFVAPDREVADIQAHLRAFLADPASFARAGANGRRVLEREHAPEAYVERILHLASRARELGTRALATRLAARVGNCIGVSEAIYSRLAAAIHSLVA
jgi:glycosyltransferase involved in cell wall biosynthesis